MVDMNFDDFDYLDSSLHDWTAKFYGVSGNEPVPVAFVVDEYLPRFEAALHRLHSTSSGNWSHPVVKDLPYQVVVSDEDDE
jgi:hypothetical protein